MALFICETSWSKKYAFETRGTSTTGMVWCDNVNKYERGWSHLKPCRNLHAVPSSEWHDYYKQAFKS